MSTSPGGTEQEIRQAYLDGYDDGWFDAMSPTDIPYDAQAAYEEWLETKEVVL